jgi:hypothetical protein
VIQLEILMRSSTRAIESNMENLQKSRKVAGFNNDDEAIYARVIKKQEELLFGLI